MSENKWPLDCIWPEPIEDGFFLPEPEEEDVYEELRDADPILDDVMKVKEYADELVDTGVLDDDYCLADDSFEFDEEELPFDWDIYYRDGAFDLDFWNESLAERYYKLKIYDLSPADDIEEILGYEFRNQNLLRQAFTRKSFALEYDCGSYEELEFIGDRILDLIVTKEISDQFTDVNNEDTSHPFESSYDAGKFTQIKADYVCKDHLSSRAQLLGLDRYILYGPGDGPSINAEEDIIEAVIGAVAADSGWNMDVLSDVVDRLVNLQLDVKGLCLKKNFYDILNMWHMRHFGEVPEYHIHTEKGGCYTCHLRYFVPENDRGIEASQYVEVRETTRSKARSRAAEKACIRIQEAGLWRNLKDSGIEPDFDNSINQLQELFQKKYVEEMPVYDFNENPDGRWYCHCECETEMGFGTASTKVKAKKKASFMVLNNLFRSSGICRPEWDVIAHDFYD